MIKKTEGQRNLIGTREKLWLGDKQTMWLSYLAYSRTGFLGRRPKKIRESQRG